MNSETGLGPDLPQSSQRSHIHESKHPRGDLYPGHKALLGQQRLYALDCDGSWCLRVSPIAVSAQYLHPVYLMGTDFLVGAGAAMTTERLLTGRFMLHQNTQYYNDFALTVYGFLCNLILSLKALFLRLYA